MHRVVALLGPLQSTFELGCVTEVFGTEREGVPRRYQLELCAQTPGMVETTSGYSMSVPRGLSALSNADTVVIPGWLPSDIAPSPATCRALRTAHARGTRLVTICSGVFALAHTGLLDGRSATTHPGNAELLHRTFPAVHVQTDVLFVDHGDIATSAGAGAGLDLCLHLVRRDHGPAYADQLARHMVMPARREGGQAKNAVDPSATTELDGLRDWVTARLAAPLTVDDMAHHLNVSPRTIARRFADQLHISPGEWLIAHRVTEARRLLERTDLSVEAIAAKVGLGSAVNLRRRFHNHVGATPSAYRRTFSHSN